MKESPELLCKNSGTELLAIQAVSHRRKTKKEKKQALKIQHSTKIGTKTLPTQLLRLLKK
jgi:hypothetical protein